MTAGYNHCGKSDAFFHLPGVVGEAHVKYLLRGVRYARTNNKFATDYYLQMIHWDFGLEALDKAVGAVEKHVV